MGAIDRVFRGRRGGQERPIAAIVAGLWKNGEQGLWYDPSDLSTMYQDATGTTPVYMPGQGQIDPPVGLLLDKRKGLARGPERLTNGSFSAGAAGWNVTGADATHIATFADGKVRYQSDTTSPALTLSQAAAGLVPDSYYEILITLSSWVSGSLKTDSLHPMGTAIGLQFTFSGVGTYRFVGKAIASNFGILRAVTNVDLTIDSISIKQLSGNHAFQPSTPSRPALTCRYNLLTNTNWSGAVVGAPGTAPTGWSANFSTAAITGVSQLGNDYAIQLTASAQRLFFAQAFSAAANTTYSLSCLVVENAGVPIEQMLGFTGVPAGATLQWYVNGVASTNGIFPVTGARIELRLINGSTAGTPAARVGIGCAVNATGVVGLAQPDVRVTSDGIGLPPYQRIVDANTYDTAGFPLYLRFDGVDDWMQTAPVDFSTADKLFATAALRKLSDSLAGIVVELSAVSNTSNGSFALLAPAGSNDTLAVYMRGATALTTSVPSGIPSPTSRVFTGVMDLSAAVGKQSQSRVNGARYAYASQDAGGGNFGVYPLYIGRRGGTGLPLNGRIYGLVIRSNFASEAQLAAVERYLNQKARIY